VLTYLLERAGTEFDTALVETFVDMMRRTETQLCAVPEGEHS
jgi:hypothetical protein